MLFFDLVEFLRRPRGRIIDSSPSRRAVGIGRQFGPSRRGLAKLDQIISDWLKHGLDGAIGPDSSLVIQKLGFAESLKMLGVERKPAGTAANTRPTLMRHGCSGDFMTFRW